MRKCFRLLCVTLAFVSAASASLQVRVSPDNGVTWISATNTDGSGVVVLAGPAGDWNLAIQTGLSKPGLGSASSPALDLNSFNNNLSSATGGVLIVQLSDTDFAPAINSGSFVSRITGLTDGQVTMSVWGDTLNRPFQNTVAIGSLPTVSGGPVFAEGTNTATLGTAPYSLTIQLIVRQIPGGISRLDASLVGNVPQCDCQNLSVTCPPNVTLNCGSNTGTNATGVATVIASANCQAKLTYSDAVTVSNCSANYTIQRTWIAAPSCGLPVSCVQTITVRDTNPPVLVCAGNKSADCGQAWSFDPPQAVDGCSSFAIDIINTVTNPAACGLTATRTWRAVDACGNASTCSQTVSFGCETCVPAAFKFSQDSGGVKIGPYANIRTFTTNGLSVKASAFSRTKSGGVWQAAFLGLYTGGLGVTDTSEGDGTEDEEHTVDNADRDNYVLFEFSQPVVIDRLYLGLVVDDSDLRLWIGNFNDPFNNHLTLSDAVLAATSFNEDNTGGSSVRWADVNAGKVSGNVLVVATRPGDTTDKFKLQILDLCRLTCGGTTTTNVVITPTNPPSSTLPSGWSTKDIGAVAAAGSAGYASGTLTVTGSGADIWGTADEYRYVYVPSSSDCSIVARVASIGNTDPSAKAGLIIRETLSAGAQELSVFVTAANGVVFQHRSATGGSTSTKTTVTGQSAPIWLKLVRSDDTYTAYYSANGSSWTSLGSKTVEVDSGAYIGLGVTSHNDGVLCTATFDNITITP